MKKLNKKSLAVTSLAMLVCIIVVGAQVGAFSMPLSDTGNTIIETCDNCTIGNPSLSDETLGNAMFENRPVTFNGGILVNGTEIIDTSGNFTGATAGTTGTFSSTLTVTGATTLSSTLAAGNTNVGALTYGNGVLASSTAVATGVLTQADLLTYSSLDYTLTNAANTLTLPATSTLTSFITTAGECADFRIRNLTATAATSTTIAAGTGMDLMENENGDVVIEGGNEAQLKFCRESGAGGGDITVYVDEYIDAD